MGEYRIRGSIGANTEDCKGERCVVDVIKDGSYNFFDARVELQGKKGKYECQVSGSLLECGRCQWTKQPSQGQVQQIAPITTKNVLLSTNSLAGNSPVTPGIKGTYRGFLHHERRDLYQHATIQVETYRQPGETGSELKLSAVANLHFGKRQTQETLTYRFEPRSYYLFGQIFTLERIEEDVDAIIQVVSLRDGVIQGVWHSVQFGRVGSFALYRDVDAPTPPEGKMMNSIGGVFAAEGIDLFLDTRLDASPVGSLNPLHPIVFGGTFNIPSSLSPRIAITGGSYDFYTDRIGIETEQGTQTFIGERNDDGTAWNLVKPASDLLRIQQPYSPLVFERQ